jgi:hypothetical protein
VSPCLAGHIKCALGPANVCSLNCCNNLLKAIGNWLLVFESGELDFYQAASKFNSRQSGDWRIERKSI